MIKFVLIEPCNFIDYPVGGQLSFAKQLMSVFGDEIALVGYGSEGDPIGVWFKKNINGTNFDYFAICKIKIQQNKPLIPLRIKNMFWFSFYAKKITAIDNSKWFIQAPEIMIPAIKYSKEDICYMFPGVENPLENPRYAWGKIFSSYFNKLFMNSVKRANTLLACADKNNIDSMISRNSDYLSHVKISQFPTRYDSNLFYPMNTGNIRKQLNLPIDKTILLCSGRINKVKGWRLILETFKLFYDDNPNSLLIFVGDGEDKDLLVEKINESGLAECVQITGFKPANDVARYLNSANVYLVGSENEGWSIAMLEALACGKPIVSTNVSGASTLIKTGVNGYVVDERNATEFSQKISAALNLSNASEKSILIANRYKLDQLKNDMTNTWKVF